MNDVERDEDCDPIFDRRRSDHPVDRPTLEHAHSTARRGTLWISSPLAVPSHLGTGVLSLARRSDGLDC